MEGPLGAVPSDGREGGPFKLGEGRSGPTPIRLKPSAPSPFPGWEPGGSPPAPFASSAPTFFPRPTSVRNSNSKARANPAGKAFPQRPRARGGGRGAHPFLDGTREPGAGWSRRRAFQFSGVRVVPRISEDILQGAGKARIFASRVSSSVFLLGPAPAPSRFSEKVPSSRRSGEE